jgi:hypothetical protein
MPCQREIHNPNQECTEIVSGRGKKRKDESIADGRPDDTVTRRTKIR